MSAAAFIATLAIVQGLFVVLDLIDRHRTRSERYDGERLHFGAAIVFLAIGAAFIAIQTLGVSLAPDLVRTMDRVRAIAGGGSAPGRVLESGPGLLFSLALFYVAGFWDYAWHRFFSHHRWFWFTHEYHHLPNQVFVGMPGIIARPFAVFTMVPVVVATAVSGYAMLRALDWPLWDWTLFQLPLLLSTAVLTASHSSFLRRSWRLHRVLRWTLITTPQEHVLHHTVDLKGNYGNFTSLWDRLFGTYLDPARVELAGHRLGLAYDQDFVGTVTLGRLKIPARWRRRFQLDRYVNIEGEP